MKSLGALRIVFIYFLFSILWIFFSDKILELLVIDMHTLSIIQTYKGIFFVCITSLFLFLLIKQHDVTIYNSQKEQQEIKQRLENVIHGSNLGYWDWEYKTGAHIVNDKWLEDLGLQRDDIQNNLADWEDRIHPEDRIIGITAVENTIKDSIPYTIEFRMKHKNGHWVWIEGSGAVVQWDSEGNPLRLSGTHRNITDRKQDEAKISFLAHNDTLTELPNRTYLRKKIEHLTNINNPFAFLFLDLDGFKKINDLYGHSEGDIVIQKVAKRLKNIIQNNDFISRVGGDEFVILHENIDTTTEFCESILELLRKPFMIKGDKLHLDGSIGITYYPQSGKNFEELFKYADIAMYAAKNSFKTNYQMYEKVMSEAILKSTKLDKEIEYALQNDEFVVYFQPQIDLLNNNIIGAEALVRWEKPNGDLIFPDIFIPRAEENRSIVSLGLIVFQKSLRNYKKWEKNNLFNGRIAINISAIQLEEEDFISSIEQICEEEGVSPSHIELEITESYIMSNPEKSIHLLNNLQKLGFSISIDDFGTGYSSLSYIKKLPVNKLKIDRSFVKDLPHDNEDKAISRVIISLAKNLDLEVLAEGVETREQKEFLQENWCDSAQGYLFSKPIDEESFYKYLEKKSSLA